MVDKKLSQFDEVSTGDVSYFPVLDENTKNAKIAGTKAMPWTNCITYIPQDIKLSLNNGTLTLLAGSKVYIPNGSGVFDVLNIQSDKTVSCGSTTGKTLIRVYPDQQPYGDTLVSSFYSGSDPSGITGMFYNTTTNKITYHENGVSDGNRCSLPIAEITLNNGQVTSIDKVFNGFGYVGSTIFALPGVKGLIPNGINDDGSLKNIPFTVNNVLTTTTLSAYSATIVLGAGWINCSGAYSYNEVSNFNFELSTIDFDCIAGYCEKGTDGRIISFNPKPTFHAVDYSEFKTVKDDVAKKVDLSSDQYVAGMKTFTDHRIDLLNTIDIKQQSQPSMKYFGSVFCFDSSKAISGLFETINDQDGNVIARLNSCGFNGVWAISPFGIGVNKNGVTFTQCPTPSSLFSNGNEAATTQWFNNKIQVVSSLPANPVNGVFYFITD